MTKILLLALLLALSMAAYSPDLAKKLCHLSVASYCKKSQVQSWSCAPCKNSPLVLKNVQTFQNSSRDTLGFIGTSSQLNSIVLVFRGTLPWDIKNWISDINFIAVAYPLCNNGCKVHRGFYYAFLDIKNKVLEAVARYQKTFGLTNIIVTGHSLGAAIATHTTAHLLANNIKVTQFYNFGSPRVGDSKFTVWFDDRYGKGHFKARVTHGRDPVPHLPLKDWGFLHHSTEIFYGGSVKDGYKVCSDGPGKEDPHCSDKYAVDVNVADHLSYYGIDFAGIIVACQK